MRGGWRIGLAGVLLLALATGLWQLSKSRSFQLFGTLVPRVDTDAPVVALTFDDGPTQEGTDRILPILDRLDVRATFFVTGSGLAESPELGRRLVEAGHALGNHAYSHQRMVAVTPSFVAREVEETDALIRATGWEGAIPFRPPYGKRLFVLPWYLERTGRVTVLWDVEPESYPEVAASAEAIAEHVVANARPGSIVLLHVMFGNEASIEAVPMIVEGLRDKGLGFVTVQELMAGT